MLMLTGGEPLLNSNIIEIVKIAKRYGHLVGITTNGILLREYVDGLIEAGIDSINVSLYDGNLKIIREQLKEVTAKFPVRISKLIRKRDVTNIAFFEGVYSLARDTGCYGVYYQNFMPSSANDVCDVIFDDDQEYLQVQRSINQKFGKRLLISWPGAVKRKIRGGLDKKCRMPWWLTVVDAKGNLGLCCRHQEGKYGNIYDNFKDDFVWRRVREALLSDSPEIPTECENCYILNDPFASNI